MSKITGEIILEAIKSQGVEQERKFKIFEENINLKLVGLDRVVSIRLDDQKHGIEDLRQEVKDLKDHVGMFKALCSIARFFNPSLKAKT